MNYIVHQTSTAANGTYLQGYMVASGDEIIAKLGKPHATEDRKVKTEWIVTAGDVVLTIYTVWEDPY